MFWPHTKTLVVYENCQFPFDRLPIWLWKKKILSWNSQIGNQNTTSFLIVIQNPQKPNYADTNSTQYIYTRWAALSSREIFQVMHTFFNAIKQNLKLEQNGTPERINLSCLSWASNASRRERRDFTLPALRSFSEGGSVIEGKVLNSKSLILNAWFFSRL